MARVLKYSLARCSEQKIRTCAGQVLTVQFQDDIPMLWVLVKDTTKIVERVVHVIGTGITFVPDNSQYLTTIFVDRGHLVLHVFVEDGKPLV